MTFFRGNDGQFRAFQDIGVTIFLLQSGKTLCLVCVGNGTLPSRLMNHENVGQVVDPDMPRFPPTALCHMQDIHESAARREGGSMLMKGVMG